MLRVDYRLLKLKTEGQQYKQKSTPKNQKTQIKILTNPADNVRETDKVRGQISEHTFAPAIFIQPNCRLKSARLYIVLRS